MCSTVIDVEKRCEECVARPGIAKPSFKEDKLSDHEGILTVIKSV